MCERVAVAVKPVHVFAHCSLIVLFMATRQVAVKVVL